MKKQAYYDGTPIDETDYPELSKKFKLAYEIVYRCVEALVENGNIPIMAFSGTTRERVKELDACLSLTAPEEVEEPVEVLYDAKNEEPYDEEELEDRTPPQIVNETTKIKAETVKEATAPFIAQEEDDEPSAGEEVDEIVDHAATALMQSFTDPDGCFLIDEDGCCSINPDNPPTIADSYTAVSHIMKLKELGSVVEDKSSWMLGSAIAALEDLHGEDFSISQICEQSELNYNTTYQAVNVFKMFKNKRYKVPFSNHQEAYFAKIDEDPKVSNDFKHLILKKSETYKLGSKAVRSLCSIAKTMSPDDTVIRNIRSAQQAADLIAAYKQAKVAYIVYEDGKWFRVNGLAEAPPEGNVVIDTKNWTATANGTKTVDIPIKK